MSYLVKEISLNDGWDDFLSIPFSIYKNDPYWIAPQSSEIKRVLDTKKNPYFKNAILKLFVCYSDSKPVSRSILVINILHWDKWKKKSAFFGFFESIDDDQVVKCLFDRIESECRILGAEYLEGPFNPNHYSELGLQIDNYNDYSAFFETHNPPYYLQLLKVNGFSEIQRIHTRINKDIRSTLKKGISSSITNFSNKNITIRKFNIWKINRDLEIMRTINNDAFENNWYFLPLTFEEYKFSAKFLFLVTSPGNILFAEYKGKPVGVVQFVINFNQLIKPYNGDINFWQVILLLLKRKSVKDLILFSGGIKKEYRYFGIANQLLKSSIKIVEKYKTYSTTWISEDNKTSIYITKLFEMFPDKQFGIYSKQL